MNEQLFRKKSVERVSSPEQLNDYIRVANPSLWLVLGAVIVLLVWLNLSAIVLIMGAELNGTLIGLRKDASAQG